MYYCITHSMNTRIVGNFFQSENIAHNYENIENPKLLNNIYLEKIDFEPIVPIPILHKKAKFTDLLSCVNATSAGQLIISEKLKNIIEKNRRNGLQFFKTSVVKDNIVNGNYFSMNMYQSSIDYIDFTKSKVSVRIRKKEGGTELVSIDVSTLDEFLNVVNYHKEKMEIVKIDNIYLNNNVSEDFFQLDYSVKHVVSEKLKQEIEDAGCTGIEFQPIELSINEWLHGGEREKIYGKA